MCAVSTLNLNHFPIIPFRKLTSSKKLQVHSHTDHCFTSTIWPNRTKLLPLNNREIITKVAVSRVPGLDVSQEDGSEPKALEVVNKIGDYTVYIKEKLSSICDGRVSVSPYDTAWIALIRNQDGHDSPQFPSSLEWIAHNQLLDGSWGDQHFFCPFDRLLNTLACVVALRSWNVHFDKSEKGISFMKENLHRLENTSADHMTCGFEIVFPSLLERAKNLGIYDIPYDAPVMREIYITRDRKLERIPKELMHKVPTTLLFSLEGLEDLDWQKLLKLQTKSGSFLTSPSSTAFAFMETKDDNCLRFIKNIVEQFNGGAPHSYPVDLFANLWAIDRIQRLGISSYFESEIKDCLNYVHRFWTEKGAYSARDVGMTEIDTTSMGFRLLRLHGYDVNPNVFRAFKMENKFYCHAGEMIESPSPIYSLYRASQLLFPGEKILEEAKDFSYMFLRERIARNQLLDKWVISKNLPDEIRNGVEIPWYSCLPRVEARFYMEHYAGANEVWIGKTYYRMHDISNNEYLELARLDFSRCQAQHQIEWSSMQEWYDICNVGDFGMTKKDLLFAYFLATASIFEPERSRERTAWAKSQIISKMITSFLNKETATWDQNVALLMEFGNNTYGLERTNSGKTEQGLFTILRDNIHQFLEGFDEYTGHQLKKVWGEWLLKLLQGMANDQEIGELIATTLNICAGHVSNEEILLHPEYKTLAKLTNKICQRLCDYQNKKVMETDNRDATNSNVEENDIDHDMRTLVQLVLEESESGGINRNIKQTFLMVAKTYYYSAYTAPEKTEIHIFKVLFESVV